MNRRSDRRAFADANALLTARGSARSASSAAMRAYLALFIVLIVVIPVLRALILALAGRQSIVILTAASTPAAVALVAAALILSAASVGRTRGAIIPRPAYVQFIVRTLFPQRLTLRRPLVAAYLVAASVVVVAISVACAALAVAGLVVNPLAIAAVLVAGAAYGVVLVTAWLAGQASRGVRLAAGIVLTAAAVAVAIVGLVGDPTHPAVWGRTAMDAIAAAALVPALFAIAGSVAIAATCAAFAPQLLDHLRSSDVLMQARIWASAGVMAQTGDVRGSLERVRAPARHTPRRVRLHAGPVWWLILKRDATGTVRHPVRLVIGIATALLAGSLVTAALVTDQRIGGVIAAVAGLLGYLSAGSWSDGVRAHADNVGAPALFGSGTQTLALAHLLFPAIVSCVVMAAGAALTVALTHSVTPIAIITAAAFALTLVALHGVSSVKGPLPITLLLPVPTPVGDVSILFALAWAFDGVLIAVALGVGLGTVVGTSIATLPALAIPVVVAFAIWGRMRLRRLQA